MGGGEETGASAEGWGGREEWIELNRILIFNIPPKPITVHFLFPFLFHFGFSAIWGRRNNK